MKKILLLLLLSAAAGINGLQAQLLKTYRNEHPGFSFLYTSDWQMLAGSNMDSAGVYFALDTTSYLHISYDFSYDDLIRYTAGYQRDYSRGTFNMQVAKTTIGGEQAREISYSYVPDSSTISWYESLFAFTDGHKIVRFEFYAPKANYDVHIAGLRKTLSTVSFTQQQVSWSHSVISVPEMYSTAPLGDSILVQGVLPVTDAPNVISASFIVKEISGFSGTPEAYAGDLRRYMKKSNDKVHEQKRKDNISTVHFGVLTGTLLSIHYEYGKSEIVVNSKYLVFASGNHLYCAHYDGLDTDRLPLWDPVFFSLAATVAPK